MSSLFVLKDWVRPIYLFLKVFGCPVYIYLFNRTYLSRLCVILPLHCLSFRGVCHRAASDLFPFLLRVLECRFYLYARLSG